MRSLLLLASTALLGACTSAPNNTFDLHFPVEDTYVSPQQPATPPFVLFGTRDYVQIGRDAAGSMHHAYVKFDLSSLPDDPRLIRESTLLSLDEFRSVPQPWEITLRAAGDQWNENTIRWGLEPTQYTTVWAAADVNDFGMNSWNVTQLIRAVVGGSYSGDGWMKLSPSGGAQGLIRVPSHESGASGFSLVTDLYEMTLDVTTDGSGLSTMSVSGAVPGVAVHYYGSDVGRMLSQMVADPPDAWVDIESPKRMAYGPPKPDGTDTYKETLGQRYPNAASVWVQAVARDGDRFLLSNPVKVNLP